MQHLPPGLSLPALVAHDHRDRPSENLCQDPIGPAPDFADSADSMNAWRGLTLYRHKTTRAIAGTRHEAYPPRLDWFGASALLA